MKFCTDCTHSCMRMVDGAVMCGHETSRRMDGAPRLAQDIRESDDKRRCGQAAAFYTAREQPGALIQKLQKPSQGFWQSPTGRSLLWFLIIIGFLFAAKALSG